MNTLTAFFIVGIVVAGLFLAWLYSKSGKNGWKICNNI